MRVMIFGAGGLGTVVADLVRACGHTVAGFVDTDETLVGREVEPGGGRVLLNDDEFFEILEDEEQDYDAVALAITDNKVRLRLFFELTGTVGLPVFQHPSAVVSPNAELGEGTLVLPLSVVSSTARVGRAAVIGAGAVVEGGASVGDAAYIGSNATVCRGVAVAERVHVGEGANVGSGVTVGADSRLGSSAVLTWDAAEGSNLVAPSAVTED